MFGSLPPARRNCCHFADDFCRRQKLSKKMHLYWLVPRTQMTLVLIGISALFLGGLTFKNRGHWGSR